MLLLTAVGAMLGGAQDLRRDELRCEEAVQRISDCCGASFNPDRVDCSYIPPGCGSGAKPPAISESEADQIFGESCDAVAAKWRCAAQ